MKFYVAGKFEDKNSILDVYEKLRSLGHEVSYDWTGHKTIKPYHENQDLAKEYAENEMQGICDTDVFIYISAEGGTTSKMEIGAAILLKYLRNKPSKVYVVGDYNDKSPWFFSSYVDQKSSVNEVIEDLKNDLS